MKTFVRNTLLAAAGVVAMSLPAHAMNSTTSQDTPLLTATTAKSVQLAQRNENPGGPGLRNENPGGPGLRNENPGGPGLKKKAKKPKKKKME
jgi:hypothetical protein